MEKPFFGLTFCGHTLKGGQGIQGYTINQRFWPLFIYLSINQTALSICLVNL